ncbi:MAG: SLC13/DASS family transporter [Methylococcales bacterium]|nr:SLC13/DASS family transporter [Methylococcales bacterium]
MTQKHSLFLSYACLLSIALWFTLTLWGGQTNEIAWTASITLFTAILWITEAIPIPAASLIPFALFPFAGVLNHKEVASALGNHVILLLMGGFMLSKSLEKSGVHKRLAVYMIKLAGGNSGRRVVIGFMLASAFLSMWISNTATVLMLIPIALAVLQDSQDKAMGSALILGIAYAASLGGIGTPIGTPPNIIFISVYQETTGKEIDFISWMEIALPIVIIGLPLIAFWLTRHVSSHQSFNLPKIDFWRPAEKRVLIVFGLIAIAWITRRIWSEWFDLSSVGDSTIALLGVVLMFMIPNGEKQDTLLDWESAKEIPWGLLLLFAGGIAIAKAFTASGLSELLGNTLTSFSSLPLWALILSLCLFVTFLTEITSNTATATLLMPVLAAASLSTETDPKLLMIPAAISASCAFMLPVATAPNAIAYGTGYFEIKNMAKEGLVLNIVLACVVSGVCYFMLD